MIKALSLALLLFLPLSQASEEVYKTVDKDGKVTYTDSPPKDKAEKVELSDINTIPAPDGTIKHFKAKKKKEKANYELFIQAPADGSRLNPTQKTLNVSVSLNRTLDDEHYLRLLLNGLAVGPPGKSTSLSVGNLRKGTKSVAVSIVDQQGNTLLTSAPIKVHVLRANAKAR